jgi:hypothetical protein
MQNCPNWGERHPDRARFCMMCGTAFGTRAAREATRKVVTVVFADVGSTAIGERWIPEAVRLVLSRSNDPARETLERNGAPSRSSWRRGHDGVRRAECARATRREGSGHARLAIPHGAMREMANDGTTKQRLPDLNVAGTPADDDRMPIGLN